MIPDEPRIVDSPQVTVEVLDLTGDRHITYIPRQQLTPGGPIHGGFTMHSGPLSVAEELSLAGQNLHMSIHRLTSAIDDNPEEYTPHSILLKLNSLCADYQTVYNAQEQRAQQT